MLALLRNPEQWRRLVAQPELAARAVEELLRYDTSIQFGIPRIATADFTVEDTVIPAGETVMPAIGAGNHDPRRFERADELDILRPDPAPLSFGGGPHFCLGSALARLEGAIAFERLARRLPRIELADEQPHWLASFNMRGLERLDVRILS